MPQEIENNFEERKKDWNLTGLLDDVIRRYIHQLTNDELNEINLEKSSGMPDEEIKNGIKLPLAVMQQRRETWGSVNLEKPNEEKVTQQSISEKAQNAEIMPEISIPISEHKSEETAVPDLNSAPEISIPSSNNEEVMQHQNTTPESPEAEHQQAKIEDLMDISLPFVDQEPFQEILQALLKNDMSQAANLLQYLGSHLDKLQEKHQKMQVEFRELKEQINSIDERFF